ncbi:MAG: DUF4349 domain-containing protein [Lysobacteraceae bacterium]|nr:MAG: DUF4349 domain-containing protein [Xanthomonadaceae bacterium]
MRTHHPIRIAMCAALFAGLIACAKHEQAAEASMEAASPATAAADAGGAAESRMASQAPTEAQLTSSAATYTDAQRKFIRTAQAKFRVRDVYQSALAIEDAVAAQGGFVTKNDIDTNIDSIRKRSLGNGQLVELAEYTVRGELTVRVPSDKAQAFLRSIIGQMDFLDTRSFAAMDAQFALLREQLAYQRNQEAQLELGDAQDEGGKLGQKAQVIAARVDAKSGRDEALIAQKEFEDRVAFATLDLSLYQLPKLRRTEMADMEAAVRDNGPGFLTRLGKSLSTGWFGLLEIGLLLVRLWPLWLLLALGLLAIRRLRRRRV